MGWRKRAACADLDVDLWFPNESIHDPKIPRARAICEGCPVWEPCLRYALDNPEIAKGIYGGLLERERRNLDRSGRHPNPMVRERAIAARYGFYQQTLTARTSDGPTLVQVREGFTT